MKLEHFRTSTEMYSKPNHVQPTKNTALVLYTTNRHIDTHSFEFNGFTFNQRFTRRIENVKVLQDTRMGIGKGRKGIDD